MKKKYVFILLSALCIALVGCNDSQENSDSSSNSDSSISGISGISSDSENEIAAVASEEPVDDGYALSKNYDDVFLELYEQLEGEWISEDELSCITISNMDDTYYYDYYDATIGSSLKHEGCEICLMEYNPNSEHLPKLEANEEVICIEGNTDIMQYEVDVYMDKANEYIKVNDVKYYSYEGDIPVEHYIQSDLLMGD